MEIATLLREYIFNLKKIIFNLKRSTPYFMIYGELGITPITVDIKARLASYWSKLVENKSNTLTSVMYTIIYHMHKINHYRSNYIESIKKILKLMDSWDSGCLRT